jgi:hypothetical protein
VGGTEWLMVMALILVIISTKITIKFDKWIEEIFPSEYMRPVHQNTRRKLGLCRDVGIVMLVIAIGLFLVVSCGGK